MEKTKREYFTINPDAALTQLIRLEYERSRQISIMNGDKPKSLSGFLCGIIDSWFTLENQKTKGAA